VRISWQEPRFKSVHINNSDIFDITNPSNKQMSQEENERLGNYFPWVALAIVILLIGLFFLLKGNWY
jgi:hypothetical protein